MIGSENDTENTMVREIMSTEVTAATEKRTVEECMTLMTRRRVRHLPVFEGDELAGMVSIGDIVNAVIHDQAIVIDQLQPYISGSY
ncbi:MAG: CBS domain-containing protein [Alkalispirochaeta sp.]